MQNIIPTIAIISFITLSGCNDESNTAKQVTINKTIELAETGAFNH